MFISQIRRAPLDTLLVCGQTAFRPRGPKQKGGGYPDCYETLAVSQKQCEGAVTFPFFYVL
jgi:hypothetical protein